MCYRHDGQGLLVPSTPSTAICSGLPIPRSGMHPFAMGTKSRESIYGASIRAAAERAMEARKEADRLTTNQAAIIALFRVVNRYVGNLAPMPGVFPEYPATPSSFGGPDAWAKTLEPLGNGDKLSQRLNLHFFHDLFPVRLDRALGTAQFARDMLVCPSSDN